MDSPACREFAPCTRLQERLRTNRNVSSVTKQCPTCGCLHLTPCSSPCSGCVHTRVAFFDGSCLGNGSHHKTKSGVGIMMGDDEAHQWRIPVDESVDANEGDIDNDRIEALGLRDTLAKIRAVDGEHFRCDDEKRGGGEGYRWVAVTDSRYVLGRLTKGLRHRGGNLDVLEPISDELKEMNRERDRVSLWFLPREQNKRADHLARHAAKEAPPR